jgi:hypothetical protein
MSVSFIVWNDFLRNRTFDRYEESLNFLKTHQLLLTTTNTSLTLFPRILIKSVTNRHYIVRDHDDRHKILQALFTAKDYVKNFDGALTIHVFYLLVKYWLNTKEDRNRVYQLYFILRHAIIESLTDTIAIHAIEDRLQNI